MAEIDFPGVSIEEVASTLAVVQQVSTSTMGIVGFADRGPTDVATLCTSFEQFTRIFGQIREESFLAVSMAAFYQNGGTNAYVVRVVPADATASECSVRSQTTQQQIETGDGATVAFTADGDASLLKDHDGATPLVEESISISWRGEGVAVAAGAAAATPATVRNRSDSADVPLVNGTAKYEGIVRPALVPAKETGHYVIIPGTAVITWDPTGAGNSTLAIVGTDAIASATNGNGSVATIDHRTGRLSVEFVGADIPDGGTVGNLRCAFQPTTTTNTITDDGAGALTGAALTGPGTIDYNDGSYSFTTTGGATPHDEAPILATYQINDFQLGTFKGTWSAEHLRVDIKGNPDFFDADTSTFTQFDVTVLLLNDDTSTFETLEFHEEVDFSDPTAKNYFANVMNALSDIITVTEPAGEEPPLQLQGIARSFVIAGGDESTGNRTLTSASTSCNVALPDAAIAKRTVSIPFTGSDDAAYEVTDDGNGNLVGDIDATYATSITVSGETLEPNTISYTTGRFNFRTSIAIKASTLVNVLYVSAPEETTHSELFGDPDKGYTAGTDGTFDATNYGRDQFTNFALLSPTFKGMYALDKVDEILQLVIPDFAGDVTITGDILDYVDNRALLSAGGDRFAILTVPRGSTAQEAVDWFKFELARFSKYAALYSPWINIADPLAPGMELAMPPMAHIAGIYARTDQTKNVAKAPAGTVDGALRFISSLETVFSEGEQGLLARNKLNALIKTPQTGMCVFGARTISAESAWRFINVRRLFMFVEKSIYISTFWICFENNGPALWGRIKQQIDGFLQNLFNAQMLKGTSPSQAFKVKVDASNNPQSTQDLGQVIIDVSLAGPTPAERARFRVAQLSAAA